jgi:hypothetical protein
MDKKVAVNLEYLAKMVSNKLELSKRNGKDNDEKYFVQEIITISDYTAICIFENNIGKRELCFFYYIPTGESMGWKYFFPTDSHLLGFRAFDHFKFEIDRYNHKL